MSSPMQMHKNSSSDPDQLSYSKLPGENPVDAAVRLATQAEKLEHLKNIKGAEQSNRQASAFYLEALALVKQQKLHDPEALKTLELLAETHRRKAKILALRLQSDGRDSVKSVMDKLQGLKKEKQMESGKAMISTRNQGAEQIEKQKQQRLEREKYITKMKEQLMIVNREQYLNSRKELEDQVEYLKQKLQKMDSRFQEILKVFKASFNEQTRELILSHGEKFITVQTNPFAAQALKESVSISRIEKNSQKLEHLLDAYKKFQVLINKKFDNCISNFDQLIHKDNCVSINFGQLTALASTPVGQAIGMGSVLAGGESNRLINLLRFQFVSKRCRSRCRLKIYFRAQWVEVNLIKKIELTQIHREIKQREKKTADLEKEVQEMKRQQRELVKMCKSSDLDIVSFLALKEEHQRFHNENTRLQTVVAGQQAKIQDQETQIKELDRKYQKYYNYVKKNYKAAEGSILKPQTKMVSIVQYYCIWFS